MEIFFDKVAAFQKRFYGRLFDYFTRYDAGRNIYNAFS